MNCSSRTFFPISGVLAALCFITLNLCASTSQVAAAVPQPQAEKFVNALVDPDNGATYPDVAIYYLEKIYKDGTISAEYKSIYDMEMGRLHMLNSGIQASQDDQLKEIDAAHESFAKFIKENPKHPRIRECASQYAGLMMARGTIYRDLSVKSTNKKQAQRDEWMKTSRDSFNAAQNEFLANKARAREVIEKFNKEKKEKGEEFEEAVNDFLQAWLAVAGAYYEIAQTYSTDSKEYKDALEKSRKEYNAIFEKYGTKEPPYIAGLYARVREGRIMMDQGVFEDPNKMDKGALSIFDETLTLDNNAANRTMRDEALLYYLQSAVKYKNDKEPEKKGKILDQALARFSEWYEKDYTSGRLGQILTQQLLLAGCDVAAEKISNLPEDQKKARQNALLAKNSLDILEILAKTQFKDEARAVKSRLGVVGPVENIPPEKMSFAELTKELGQIRETIADIQSASASAQTDEEKAEFQKKMKEAGEKFLKIYYLLEARRPSDISGLQLRQLNSNRYLAVYMMFLNQDNYRAIMLSDFVVKNYSTDPTSETMADLEMKILRSQLVEIVQKMKNDGKSEADIQAATKFELLKMAKLAQIIQTRTKSKGSEMADNAWSIVCESFIDIGDTKHAVSSLSKISESSESRAGCEIRIGNQFWNNYLHGMRADLSSRPSKEKLAEYKNTSQKILQDGINRMKANMGPGEEPTSNLVFAAFTLANLKLNSGDADGALELLNDPQFGPLTLIKKDSPLVLKNELDVRALRIALRALVAAQKLVDAQTIMDLLEKRVEQSESVAENGKSKEEQLTNIYIALGLELKENLEVFNREGQKEKANELEKGFEIFLQKIASLPDIKFGQMYWVAQTYQSLGENEVNEAKEVNEKAKDLFKKAVETYEKILSALKDKKDFVKNPDLTTRIIDERLARCLATSEQYDKAIEKMGGILSKTPNNIDLQAEAVRCYQKWAKATADPEQSAAYLKKALVGCGKDFHTTGQKDPKQDDKPAIWGWNTLSNKMQTQLTKKQTDDPRISDIYFEARLTISKIYAQQAEGMKDSAKQLARLQDAENVLVNTHRTFPTLNNEETFNEFDKQLRIIRTKMHAIDSNIVVQGFSKLDTAKGFATKGNYEEAITRIKNELATSKVRKDTYEEMQSVLADYYYKWGEKIEDEDPEKARDLYNTALEGSPDLSESGKPIFIGLNGILKLKSLVNDKGEPIRSSKPDEDKLIPYLQVRITIAEIKYNLAMLEIAAAAPKEEQPAEPEPAQENSNKEEVQENAADEEAQPENSETEENAADASVSETTSDETADGGDVAADGETAAEGEAAAEGDAPADGEAAVEEDAAATEPNTAQDETKATQTSNESDAANEGDSAAQSSIPPSAIKLLNEVEAILREDYTKYKTTQADTDIMGNSDILQSYETLLRKVQEQLGKPVSGFAPPESLKPKIEEPEIEEGEKPLNPIFLYSILGGLGFLGLVILIIMFLPKKKKLVEKQKVNVTDGGIAIGSEKVDDKVDLGFAQQEGQAQKKIDLGFGGFSSNDEPASNGKIDLGFGTPQQDSSFSFDFTKPTQQSKPAQRPSSQQPGKPISRPGSQQQPSGNQSSRPSSQQPGKPIPRPGSQQQPSKPQNPSDNN